MRKGGGLATNWKNFDRPDGSAVRRSWPTRCTGPQAYAVTENGVFHMPDWSSSTPTWEEITTNLPNISHTAFFDGTQAWTNGLLIEPAVPGNTEATLYSLEVDWRPIYAATVSKPILYVGGDGGVFRATNEGGATVWNRFPASETDGGLATKPGGEMPIVKVTELDLSTGEVDPFTGRQDTSGIANVLIASTLGRGTWAVSLGQRGDRRIRPEGHWQHPVFANAGPNNQFPALDRISIRFDKFMEATSFTKDDIKVTTPAGNTLPTSPSPDEPGPASDNSLW